MEMELELNHLPNYLHFHLQRIQLKKKKIANEDDDIGIEIAGGNSEPELGFNAK